MKSSIASAGWLLVRLSVLTRTVRSWNPHAALPATRPPSATRLYFDIPFFASSSTTEKLSEGRASITNRLPIGKIFDSRDYIFSTASNVRGYEWTLKETEELLDDLVDASRGAFSIDENGNPDPKAIQDYELSQCVLIPMEWDKEAYGLGGKYDVYDGQQRLVTLCLLFAAMRERFRQLDDVFYDENHGETVQELAEMLKPSKPRKKEVVRIELNSRDNTVLSDLLEGGEKLESIQKLLTDTKAFQKLTLTNQRILENFSCLVTRMANVPGEELLSLLDFVTEKVYLLVCIPENASIARNIVVGQGKGKDNEPIDDFKGLVCFRYTQDEKKMYKAFDEWDALSSSVIDLDAGVVGRKTVSDACLLRASAQFRTKIGSSKQLFWWEQWLRSDVSEKGYQGSDFFQIKVRPASRVLGDFRDGESTLPFGLSKNGKTNKHSQGIQTSLDFIKDLIQRVPSTKEVELLVLELLLRAAGNSNQPMTMADLESYLLRVEELVLYFALVRPTATVKYNKCFAFLDALDDDSKKDSSLLAESILTTEERSDMYQALIDKDLGANTGGKRLSLALLKRLNRHIVNAYATNHEVFLEPILPVKATKKDWGDAWPEKTEREEWCHKIGNLCLVSKKVSAKESKAPFAGKKERYGGEESWLPLTSGLAEHEAHWDVSAVRENSDAVVGLVKSVWGTDSSYFENAV